MQSIITFMFQFFQQHETLVWLISGVSVVLFLGFLIGTPIIVVKLPADYFKRRRPLRKAAGGWSVSRLLYLFLKNVLGVVLVLAGIAMLFLPGQGLITIIIGLSLLHFPGKRRLVRRIVGEKHVLGSLNRLRARFNKPAFQIFRVEKSVKGRRDLRSSDDRMDTPS